VPPAAAYEKREPVTFRNQQRSEERSVARGLSPSHLDRPVSNMTEGTTRSDGNGVSIRYAQAILQLYAQLRRRGCSEDELLCVRNAYDLAVPLFASRFRSNGKPFLAHLVGTGSILALHGASIPVVAAGLLHPAYLEGDFGDAWTGITNARRRQLREAVDGEVEKLVHGYTCFAWNHQTIMAMPDHLDMLNAEQRHLVLMRLANDLEDHLDLGMLYSRKQDRVDERRQDRRRSLVTIAERLGYCELAHELGVVYADHDAADVPDTLRTHHTSSYTVAPAHCGGLSRVARYTARLVKALRTV
jgi:HD domain